MAKIDKAAKVSSGESGPLDAADYVDAIWNSPLRSGGAGAEIIGLWEGYQSNAAAAQKEFGRQVGIGGPWYFCVRGQGTVESVEGDRVLVRVRDSPRRACLELGTLVGSTVRDAVGAKASDFTNSQDFNAIAAALNRRVEEEVIAPNREALQPGVTLDFVGCAKISRKSDLDPLCLIPIRLRIRDSGGTSVNAPDAVDGLAPL
ncbi:DUF2291 family protein [Posidoniimonas corsicana]|nr:DUF2291 family protein [Posidoniimonas corsicana]